MTCFRRLQVRSTATSLLLVIAVATAGAATAFQINPLKNKYLGNSPRGGFMERITESVHEDITDAAVACDAQWQKLPSESAKPACSSYEPPRRSKVGNKANSLIRGVWWNDDPNQLLWRVDYPTWVFWMKDARGIATKGRNWLGRRAELNSTYKMQYRSHYGDLQFLHSMATGDDEPATVTRERMLLWAGFAYRVAIEQIAIGTKMEDLDDELARRYFQNQPGWTVNYLFGPKYRWTAEAMPQVALGSILHMLQDSFSDAHVERRSLPTPLCPEGGVAEFHSYGRQDPGKHGDADTRTALVSNRNLTDRVNPVEASARMLAFARTKADWTTVVKPYLRDVVLCMDQSVRSSGPGAYLKVHADHRGS